MTSLRPRGSTPAQARGWSGESEWSGCQVIAVGGWVLLFFSSRRRHTRCSRDWSSDVCSSDLELSGVSAPGDYAPIVSKPRVQILGRAALPMPAAVAWPELSSGSKDSQWIEVKGEIGRASCRERV